MSIISCTVFMLKQISLGKNASAESVLCDDRKESYLEDLQEGEEVKAFAIHDNKKGHFAAVTNKRLVFDTNDGRASLPYNQIKKVKYKALGGSTTRSPGSVFQITIKADKTYNLYCQSSNFSKIPAALMRYC